MEIKDMNFEELEQRKAEIAGSLENASLEELKAINAELDAIEERKKEIKAEAEERAKAVEEVIKAAEPTPIIEERTKPMEVRNTPEYFEAYKNYIITGDDKEARALLKTENASGKVPVPVFVDEIVRTAWENDDILSRVRKTYFKGNVKVAFEAAADGAYEHTEGATAVTEESLTLAIVTMVPKNIKKWITISDESVAMGGEAFLRYVYDELTYQIVKKLRDLIVADIAGLATSGTTAPIAPQVSVSAIGIGLVAEGLANLSDEARNPVAIMNRLTWGAFKAAQASNNYGYDPFEGLPVLFSSALPAFSAASANDIFMIVGDLDGAQVNYPEGEDVVIKWDDLSLAEKDVVKVVGRQYAAHGVTANGRFCNFKKVNPTT